MKRTFQSISGGLPWIFTRLRLIAACGLLLCLLGTGRAQGEGSPGQKPSQTTTAVTASATAERVRFTAPSNVVRMQLQIISENGQILFDVSSKGNVLDWSLQDGSGQRLQGSYLMVVTVKSIAGRLSERVGSVSVAEQQVELKAVDTTGLTPAQQQAVGPIEEHGALTILKADEGQAVTVVANDGKDGQIVRERGSLSFRLGDFFSGNDKEQMRLTEEGNLGIGTAKPKARLDVAGMIRAREGFMFSDGSTLKINEKGVLTRTSADGTVPSAVNSTQNQIAKFTDNAGTLGDSSVTETGGQVGIGTAAPASLLHLAGPAGVSAITLNTPGSHRFRFQTVPDVPNWGALTLNANYNAGWFLDETATNGWFFKLDTRGGNANGPNNGLWLFRIPPGPNPHTDEGPVFGVSSSQAYFAGNLGIGTLTPSSKLTVAGLIETSTGGIKFPDGTIQTTAGVGGGGNAILNQTTLQAGANFNISGNGTAGGTVSADVVNAETQYNIGGNRVLSAAGLENVFAGFGAGQVNTTGASNSFFGKDAGLGNTTGIKNTHIGYRARASSDAQVFSTAIGSLAEVGCNHCLVLGETFGFNTAQNSVKVGIGTTTPSERLEVVGNVKISSDLAVDTNTLFVNAGNDRVGIGITAPTERLHVVGNGLVTGNLTVNGMLNAALPTGSGNYIQNSTAQQSSSDFNISGNGTAGGTLSANAVNAATQYNIGGNRILSVAGTNNLFAGTGAGQASATTDSNSFFGSNAGVLNTGDGNSFFGKEAGQSNTDGNFNSFFGTLAGQANIFGQGNSFFGIAAGFSNNGSNNAFFGRDAGHDNTTGDGNAFFGTDAGRQSTTGFSNSFFGSSAGYLNGGSGNSFFGAFAGFNETGSNNSIFGFGAGQSSTGASNSFFGKLAGSANVAGSNNTIIGSDANVGSGALTNATAIGANAFVTASDSVVLGNNAKVGIGTPAPTERLHVVGNGLVTGNLTVSGTLAGNGAGISSLNASNLTSGTLDNARLGVVPLANGGTGSATQNFVDLTNAQTISGDKTFSNTLSGNVISATTQYNILGSRVLSVAGTNNFFAGINAGLSNTTGNFNAFFGKDAGKVNTEGSGNSFFGSNAGIANTTGGSNSFFGKEAGIANTAGQHNSFFGALAGFSTTSNSNAFFGRTAGYNTTTGGSNAFFGSDAGNFNTTGGSNSFFGKQAGTSNTTGSNNTTIGFFADVASGNLTNATAIGANAVASVSDSVVLGNNANVGIGMSTFPSNFSGKLLSVASSARDNGGITVGGNANAEVLYLYANTTSNYAGIQVKRPNVTVDNLVLQEQGGNVGIGTITPNAKLQITNGDAAVSTPGNGLILRATNGPNCYRLTVDNSGVVATALVACP